LLAKLPGQKFDIAWVDNGELIDPSLVRELKQRCSVVLNYNIDDPFGPRDGRRWRLYLDSLSEYDLIVVVRKINIEEAWSHGARNIIYVSMTADEIAHRKRQLTDEDRIRWSSQVVFAGTWMPERGPFLARLIDLGVPLTIYGDRWNKAKEWPTIQPHWRGPGLYNDDDYAKALQSSKICLGLLSKGNRDLSTTRSFEIPYMGALLCAERTSEHIQLYQEDEEACFWSSPEECAEKCLRLLSDKSSIQLIADRGRERCLRNGTGNQLVVGKIIERALSCKELRDCQPLTLAK